MVLSILSDLESIHSDLEFLRINDSFPCFAQFVLSDSNLFPWFKQFFLSDCNSFSRIAVCNPIEQIVLINKRIVLFVWIEGINCNLIERITYPWKRIPNTRQWIAQFVIAIYLRFFFFENLHVPPGISYISPLSLSLSFSLSRR